MTTKDNERGKKFTLEDLGEASDRTEKGVEKKSVSEKTSIVKKVCRRENVDSEKSLSAKKRR